MVFKYEGHDARASHRKGEIEASSLEAAAEALREQGIYAMDLQPQGAPIKAVLGGRIVDPNEPPPAHVETVESKKPPKAERVEPAPLPQLAPVGDSALDQQVLEFLARRIEGINRVVRMFNRLAPSELDLEPGLQTTLMDARTQLGPKAMVVQMLQDAAELAQPPTLAEQLASPRVVYGSGSRRA